MGVIANRFYNDPGMAQAASNLASLFAPPSGSDMAGFANARAKDAEAARLAEVFAYSKSPDYNQEQADRELVGAGVYPATQSYYAVNQDTLSKKYNTDVGARTLRANNAADNERAIATDRADNLRALYATGYGNIGTGETRPAMPLSVTSQFGGTEGAPGAAGPVKPLSLDEWTAAQADKAKAGGLITDQDIADAVNGKETPIQVLTAEGKTAWMSPGEAVRTGATPVPTLEQNKGIATKDVKLSADEAKGVVLGPDKDQTPVKAVVNGKIVYMSAAEAIAKGAQAYVDPGSGDTMVKTVGKDGKPVYTPTSKAEGVEAYVDQPQVTSETFQRKDGSTFLGHFKPGDTSGRVYDDQEQWVQDAVAKGQPATPSKAPLGTAYIGNQQVPVYLDEATHTWMIAGSNPPQPVPTTAKVTNMGQPQGSTTDVTTGTGTDIQKSLIDLAVAKDTTVSLRDLIAKAPASQGAVGWLRGTAQDVAQAGTEVATYFGGPVKQMVDQAKADIAANVPKEGGVADDLLKNFDENVPRIEMLANLLAYQFAKINGDRLSNETVRENRKSLGLENLTANQASTIARLNQAIATIEAQQAILNKALNNGVGSLTTQTPAPAVPAPIVAPGATATQPGATATTAAPAKNVIQYDANGRRITK